MAKDQSTRLREALVEIHQRWGSQAVRPLSTLKPPLTTIPTDYPPLDQLIGGGVPCGRITELSGMPTSGVTTMAMKIIAQAQKQRRVGVYVDLAGDFDPDYAVKCGVHLEGLLIARPPDVASALDVLQIMAEVGRGGLSVLDHILVIPHTEHMLGAGLRKLSPALRKSGCTALILNPGPSSPVLAGQAALRLAFENQGWIEQERDITGCRVRVTVLKMQRGEADRWVDLDVMLDDTAGEEAA